GDRVVDLAVEAGGAAEHQPEAVEVAVRMEVGLAAILQDLHVGEQDVGAGQPHDGLAGLDRRRRVLESVGWSGLVGHGFSPLLWRSAGEAVHERHGDGAYSATVAGKSYQRSGAQRPRLPGSRGGGA